MKIIITAIENGDDMKTFNFTALALALFLGVTLGGCGYLGRTVPYGYHGYPSTGTTIRPTDPGGRVRYDKPYWTVEEGGTLTRTAPSGRKLPHKDGKVITQD